MKLKPYVVHDRGGVEQGYEFWCPGCTEVHRFRTKAAHATRDDGTPTPIWAFDGNLEAPTFHPSFWQYHSRGEWNGKLWVPTGPRITDCHLWLKQGVIEYLSDSAHALRSSHIPMVRFPETRVDRWKLTHAEVLGKITLVGVNKPNHDHQHHRGGGHGR